MSYFITTDAAGDLPKEMYREGLHVIPMAYTIDGTEYGIDKDLPLSDFYARVKAGSTPTTALVNSYFAAEQIRPLLQAGHDVLHIAFSSGLSGTYDNMVTAFNELKAEFPDRKIYLIDSLCASMGEGILTLLAMDARDNGLSIDDNYKYIMELTGKMCHYFTANDLFHLQRGGRVSRGTAIMGTALHINPIMYCNKVGKLVPFDKVISRKKALMAIADKVPEHIDHNDKKYLAIVHASAQADAEFVAKRIRDKVDGIENLYVHDIGPIIGSHTGCGVVALMFIGDTRIEPKDETLRK